MKDRHDDLTRAAGPFARGSLARAAAAALLALSAPAVSFLPAFTTGIGGTGTTIAFPQEYVVMFAVAAARHGLAALAGSSPDTGVVGYTLGGGISFLGRRYGLATSSVTAIEVVAADGNLVRADHEPEQPVPVAGDGLPLTSLPVEAIDALVGGAGADAPPGLVSVEVRHLGGELARPRTENGALAALGEEYALYAVGATPVPDLAAKVQARITAIKDALAPWTAAQMRLNFAETRHPAAPLRTDQAYRRLRQIKATVDPGNLIQANHPVPPA